jgi:hypothetical protein
VCCILAAVYLYATGSASVGIAYPTIISGPSILPNATRSLYGYAAAVSSNSGVTTLAVGAIGTGMVSVPHANTRTRISRVEHVEQFLHLLEVSCVPLLCFVIVASKGTVTLYTTPLPTMAPTTAVPTFARTPSPTGIPTLPAVTVSVQQTISGCNISSYDQNPTAYDLTFVSTITLILGVPATSVQDLTVTPPATGSRRRQLQQGSSALNALLLSYIIQTRLVDMGRDDKS